MLDASGPFTAETAVQQRFARDVAQLVSAPVGSSPKNARCEAAFPQDGRDRSLEGAGGYAAHTCPTTRGSRGLQGLCAVLVVGRGDYEEASGQQHILVWAGAGPLSMLDVAPKLRGRAVVVPDIVRPPLAAVTYDHKHAIHQGRSRRNARSTNGSVGKPKRKPLDHVPRVGCERVVDNELCPHPCGVADGGRRAHAGGVEPPEIQRPVHPGSFVSPTGIRPSRADRERRPARKGRVVWLPTLVARFVHEGLGPARNVLGIEAPEIELDAATE